MRTKGKVILIPIMIAESGEGHLPTLFQTSINSCSVFFAENIKTARRAFRKVDRAFPIDEKEWIEIGKSEDVAASTFRKKLQEGATIGIVSESGCPGIADPGQELVSIAQSLDAKIIPLAGPNSILLALMASGLNGQQFSFHGYLPIDRLKRQHAIQALEKNSRSTGTSNMFIETPYRNGVLYEALLSCLHNETRLCIAVNITAADEWIKTKTIGDWKKSSTDLPKSPALFIIGK